MKIEFDWRDYDDYAKWLHDVLTTLYEENEQLKVEKVKLLSENQQLKKQKDELETSYDILQKNNITLVKQKEEAYKIADDYYEENQQLKKQKDDVVEYIKNYDVFKEFSFPLMKKWEENQVKSSINYQFKESIKKDLLRMLGEIDD